MNESLIAFLVLVLIGTGAAVAGGLIIAGLGWALVVLAVISFLAAAFVKLGSTQKPE